MYDPIHKFILYFSFIHLNVTHLILTIIISWFFFFNSFFKVFTSNTDLLLQNQKCLVKDKKNFQKIVIRIY